MTADQADSEEAPDDDFPQTTIHVRGALRGEPQSTSWVVSRLTPLLLAHAEYRLGPNLRRHCDPSDLVQDAWLVALPRLGELQARRGRYTPVLLKFLTTTLLHRISNLAARHGVKDRVTLAPIDDGTANDPIQTLPSDTLDAVGVAIREEARGRVRDALDRLRDQDREVMLLRGIEQRTNQEAAEFLGLTPVATAVRYHRALQRLRETMPDSVFGELPD